MDDTISDTGRGTDSTTDRSDAPVERGTDTSNEQSGLTPDLLESISRRTFLGGVAAGAAMLVGPGNGSAQAAAGPREAEFLDRGVVAVQTDGGVLVRWRLLGTDPDGIGFTLYRDGQRVNDSSITGSTNFLDPNGSTGSTYTVAPVIDGTERAASEPADVWPDNYLDIPLNRPGDRYHPNDCSVGDLTGDGSYDVVVKWIGRQYDNTHEGPHDPVIFDGYTLDGEHLWRVDLGINVRAGAHYNPYLVYDFDGDGIAELVVRTADGTTDDAGTVIGDPNADWRDENYRILEGPEYMTVFDGETGEELVTTDFQPARGDVCDWGDCYGNRVDRFLAGVAYLDGERPSIVQARGYYDKTMLVAYDFRDGELTQRWLFDSTDPGNGAYEGQGCHSLSVADVDGDGRDEIVYGAAVIDDDGTGLYSTGWNHGDALHCSDFLPDREGLEVFMPHEWGTYGATMRDAGTGELIWGVESDADVGRGVAANVDPNFRGAEAWGSSGIGIHRPTGERIADAPASMNHLAWWTGDLQREFLDAWSGEGVIRKWDPENRWDYEVARFPETRSNNGTKGNPCLTGDILGDWREEAIWRRQDNEALRLCVTPHETDHRLYTLMHDTQYRTAIAWQNVGYNQPPHPSFYVGEDMDAPPEPNIVIVGDGFSAEISSANGADAAWHQTVPVAQDTDYTLRGWIKTRNVNADSGFGAQFNVDELGQSSLTSAVTGTTDWTQVETTINSGSNTSLQINALFGGWGTSTGTAWFDDVEFLDPSGTNLLRNADFEDSTASPWSTTTWGGSATFTHSHVESHGGSGSGPLAEGTYTIANVNSGQLLDVDGASTSDGANVLQWPDNGGTNQRWNAVQNADGTYHFVNENSGKLLEVAGAGTADGDTVQQFGDTGHACQDWTVIDNGDGTYRLENSHSGKVADVSGASTSDGADVIQWSWNGGDNQKWTFNPV